MFEDGKQLQNTTLHISSDSRKVESGDCRSMPDSSIEVRIWMSRTSCITCILLPIAKLTSWPCRTTRYMVTTYKTVKSLKTWLPNNAVYLILFLL
jgi:hypothetical protein